MRIASPRLAPACHGRRGCASSPDRNGHRSMSPRVLRPRFLAASSAQLESFSLLTCFLSPGLAAAVVAGRGRCAALGLWIVPLMPVGRLGGLGLLGLLGHQHLLGRVHHRADGRGLGLGGLAAARGRSAALAAFSAAAVSSLDHAHGRAWPLRPAWRASGCRLRRARQRLSSPSQLPCARPWPSCLSARRFGRGLGSSRGERCLDGQPPRRPRRPRRFGALLRLGFGAFTGLALHLGLLAGQLPRPLRRAAASSRLRPARQASARPRRRPARRRLTGAGRPRA